MKKPPTSPPPSNPDTAGITAALIRAGKSARRLSIETGTPFWVIVDGRIVDLNARRPRRRRRAAKPR